MKNNEDIFSFLQLFSSATAFLPFIFALLYFKYARNYLMPIFILIFISTLMEIFNLNPGFLNQKTMILILRCFTVIEFILISLFYIGFFKNYFKPVVAYLFIPCFLIVTYMDYCQGGSNSQDNFSFSTESVCFILYSLFLFYYVSKHLLFENLLMSPVFWINTAILVYFAGNLALFVFSNYLIVTDPKMHIMLWSLIHTFFNISFNSLITIGFWKTKIR